MRRLTGNPRLWAGAYIGLVGYGNAEPVRERRQLGLVRRERGPDVPLSVFAIYPILFVAGSVSAVTGGDPINGNAFGLAAVVVSFIALAAINGALVGLMFAGRARRLQSVRVSS